MPDLENAGAPAATDVAAPGAQPVAQTESGDSGDQPTLAEQNASINDALRAATGFTSKPDDTAPDGGSAPSGDVKPSGPDRGANGQFVPRRGHAVVEANQRAEEAERKLAETDPETVRAQVRAEIEAEQQRKADEAAQSALAESEQADVERYERLRDLPSSEMSVEDWNWVEERKDLLLKFPAVEKHHRAAVDRKVAALNKQQTAFWADVRGQLAETATRPGVDAAVIQTSDRWGDIGDHLYEAGRATGRSELADENRRLADENRQLRLQGPRGLAAARTPLEGGRSSAGAPPMDMNERLFGRWRHQDA